MRMNGLLVGDEERMRLMETEREGRERELRKDLEASEYAAENPCAGGSSSAGSTSAGNGAMLNKQMQFNISEKSWYHSGHPQCFHRCNPASCHRSFPYHLCNLQTSARCSPWSGKH